MSETPDMVGVVNIHFQDSHPGHMMFQGPGFHHWISNDFGRTYEPIETPGQTIGYGAEIKIHPSKPDWVLSRVRRNECLRVRTPGLSQRPASFQCVPLGRVANRQRGSELIGVGSAAPSVVLRMAGRPIWRVHPGICVSKGS